MKSSEHAQDPIDLATADATHGRMIDQVEVAPAMLEQILLSRTIPIWEWRQPPGANRTRPVDHGSQ